MPGLAKLFISIVGDSSDFENKLQQVERGVRGVGTRTQQFGEGVSKTGVGLTAGVTVPILAGAAAAAKAAVDYESAFAGVRKTVNATDDELEALSNGLRNFAKVKPISVIELADIAEAAGQLGIKTENIIPFTGVIADLSVTTNLGEDAAQDLAQFANITQMPQDQFDRLGSTIVDLGNNLATTEADIVAMAKRLAAAGNQVGLNEAEILGFAGALSSVGIEAEAGGSAISRVMADMASAVASGGQDLQEFADVAGVSAQQFAQQFKSDPALAILAFIGGLQKIQEEGGNVFGVLDQMGLSEIRVRDALLRAAGAGNLFGDAITQANRAWTENTALSNEAAQRYGTTASKLELLKNRITDVLISVGGPMIDALNAALIAGEPFFRMIESAATAFTNMSPAAQQAVVGFLGLLAAAGPVLFIVGKLITVIGGVISFFGAIPGIVATVSGAFAGLSGVIGAVIAFLTGPIGLAIGVVALAIGGLALAWRNNWFDIQGVTANAVSALAGFWQGTLLPAIQAVGSWLQTNLFPILGDLARLWLAGVRLELAILGVAFRAWWGIVTTAAGIVRNALGGALQWVISLLSRFGFNLDNIRAKIQGAIGWVQGLADRLNALRLPAWLGGDGGTVNSPSFNSAGSIGRNAGINDGLFPTATAAMPRSATQTNTANFNAPLVQVQGSIRSESDLQRVQEGIRDELRRSLGLVINQQNRYPVGF